MELRYLRYFVGVAERGSFIRAAADLNVAQSAVSEQIRILEGNLGVRLLDRSRRKVELTAAGEAFLAEARAVLQRVEQARSVARRAALGELGRLRVGCFSSAVAEFLPGLIRRFRTEFPRVDVDLKELNPAEQWEALQAGEIDVAFTRRLQGSHAARLVQERVYSDEVVAVMAESHPLSRKSAVSLDALSREGFVLFERSGAPEFVDEIRRWCAGAGFAPRIVSEVPMMQTILMYVAAGMGVSLVPGCIRCYRQAGVEFRPIRPRPPALELVMAHLKDHRSPVLEAWVQQVRTEFPQIRRTFESLSRSVSRKRQTAR